MTRVLCTSSIAGAAFLAAAIDAGHLIGRTVLLVANEADTPEIVINPWDVPGFDAVAARIDEVVHVNELFAPLHPSAWSPPAPETPVLARLLATRLAPGDEIEELVVESVTEGPGRALAELVPDVPITIAAHTLAAYGPPVVDPPSEIGGRVTRLLYLDLVPVLRPLLRYDSTVAVEALPVTAFRAALAPVVALGPTGAAGAVMLGDRYAELGLLPADDELEAYRETIRALVAAGQTEILFAPHPAAGPLNLTPLVAAAQAAGARLVAGPAGVPHEVWAADTSALVVGTGSSAIFLATHGVSSGCRRVLDLKLRYVHAVRMPLTIADAGLPRLEANGTYTQPTVDLAHLVDAVAFCMTPDALPDLRNRTADWVSRHGATPYLRLTRLRELGVLGRSRPRRVAARARTWLASRGPSTQP